MRQTLFAACLATACLATALTATAALPGPAAAHEPMTLARMGEIVTALDPTAEQVGNAFTMVIDDVPIFIVTDPGMDRMRAMTAIRSAEGIGAAELQRMMQANFDSALDARYAVAKGRLWGVFIHPLAALEKDQLISGLGQVVNLALTYGSAYSSGALTFGGGDSGQILRDRIERLQRKGEPI